MKKNTPLFIAFIFCAFPLHGMKKFSHVPPEGFVDVTSLLQPEYEHSFVHYMGFTNKKLLVVTDEVPAGTIPTPKKEVFILDNIVVSEKPSEHMAVHLVDLRTKSHRIAGFIPASDNFQHNNKIVTAIPHHTITIGALDLITGNYAQDKPTSDQKNQHQPHYKLGKNFVVRDDGWPTKKILYQLKRRDWQFKVIGEQIGPSIFFQGNNKAPVIYDPRIHYPNRFKRPSTIINKKNVIIPFYHRGSMAFLEWHSSKKHVTLTTDADHEIKTKIPNKERNKERSFSTIFSPNGTQFLLRSQNTWDIHHVRMPNLKSPPIHCQATELVQLRKAFEHVLKLSLSDKGDIAARSGVKFGLVKFAAASCLQESQNTNG